MLVAIAYKFNDLFEITIAECILRVHLIAVLPLAFAGLVLFFDLLGSSELAIRVNVLTIAHVMEAEHAWTIELCSVK